MTGEPPFWLEYIQTVRETGASSVVRVDVAKSRHSLVFKPTDPGTYQYEFVKVNYFLVEVNVVRVFWGMHFHNLTHSLFC